MSKKKLKASELSKKASRKNIKEKISILRKWSHGETPWQKDSNCKFVRDVNGDKIIEWFPTKLSQFCIWDGSQNSDGTQKELSEIKTISRATLYQEYNSDFKTQLEELFPALLELKDKMLAESSNYSIVMKLEKDVSYWKTLAKAESAHVISVMEKFDKIDIEFRKLQRVKKNNEEALNNMIKELEIEVSALTKVVNKIKPIGAVK